MHTTCVHGVGMTTRVEKHAAVNHEDVHSLLLLFLFSFVETAELATKFDLSAQFIQHLSRTPLLPPEIQDSDKVEIVGT